MYEKTFKSAKNMTNGNDVTHNTKHTILINKTKFTPYSVPPAHTPASVLGNLTLLGNQFWDLTSAPLTKLQYLFSWSISGIFVRAAYRNYCTHGACSETAIKTK
jgi:hypothetical protein